MVFFVVDLGFFNCFFVYFLLVIVCFVVGNSAIDCLERLVSKMQCVSWHIYCTHCRIWSEKMIQNFREVNLEDMVFL